MAKRKKLEDDYCPVARSVDVIGDRWSLLIIREAFDGLTRFGEFQKSLRIARNILTDRLNILVNEGIFELMPISEEGLYQKYILTDKGRGLFFVVVSLRQWGEQYLFKENEPHSFLVERIDGQPIQKIQINTRKGTLLVPEDTIVKKHPIE